MLKKIITIFTNIKSHIDGDFAYEKYVNHCKIHHKSLETLNKKDFLKKRQKEKFERINRCC